MVYQEQEKDLKKRLNTEVLAERYRKRVASFVVEMAMKPLPTSDQYQVEWNKKNASNVVAGFDANSYVGRNR